MQGLTGKILIVDDDPETERLISFYLKDKGYFIIAAKDGIEAAHKARHFTPDLVIIDVNIADKLQVESIRQFNPLVNILIVGNELDHYKIKDPGILAYDYIPKPLQPETLINKISCSLSPQLNEEEKEQKFIFGELEINISNFLVYNNGQKIVLAKKEFELLAFLATKPGRVFLRHEILQRVWGADAAVGSRTIDVHIRKIRRKIGVDVIKTVKRVGYKFQV